MTLNSQSRIRFPAMTLHYGTHAVISEILLQSKLSSEITATQVNSALNPSASGIAKSSTSFGCGKGGKVTAASVGLILCDVCDTACDFS